MPSVISGDANVSATEFGYLDGVTSALQTQMDAKLATATAASTYLPIAGGKILQIVRATDATRRTTTSTSFTDANISVTITPQKSDSAVLLLWFANYEHSSTANYGRFQITDSSNSAISGAEIAQIGSGTTNTVVSHSVVAGYSTPATTSATTYKGRFRVLASGIAAVGNDNMTGQLYAIEVSA